MKILYIGEPKTYHYYCKGIVPSHWLYGAVEMEKDGHEVIWAKEESGILNDLKLIFKYRPDIIFIPNLNITNHILLLLMSSIHILNIPIYAYLHRSHTYPSGIKNKIFKNILLGIKHIFFLSGLNMKETIDTYRLSPDHCSVPGWGPDKDFYAKIPTSDDGYYISTGKENRDFDILIEAFRLSGKPLKIITTTHHGKRDYSDLENKCKDIPNIQVVLMENSGDSYPYMLNEMARARAIVCPLRMDSITYCVGLSTIADAEGLSKPLIVTANPYHDNYRMNRFIRVQTLKDWLNAVNDIEQSDTFIAEPKESPSINKAYRNIKKIIFK